MFAICALGCCIAAPAQPPQDPPKPARHILRQMQGWTVHIDDRLLRKPNTELGARAIRLLDNQLYAIQMTVLPDRLKRLRETHIWLDLTHGKLMAEQYHPSAEWLKQNGYTAELERCVHIPNAAYFADPAHQRQQPWSVMHELAHSYHDRVLGFDDARILAAWRSAVASGRFDSVLHIDGAHTRHYALTDHKEFFAEMTEAYLGVNDFYPFNRAELRESEPAFFALMQAVWDR